MNKHESINYLEIPTRNLKETEEFFKKVFRWEFEYFGNDYMAFKEKNIQIAFFTSNKSVQSNTGSILMIFYSTKLEDTYKKILEANGKIVQETFNFPGGRRFHFEDPVGNEYAVWSDK